MMFCASGRDRTADSKFMRLSGQSTSILCDINIIFFLCQNVSLYDNQHTPKYIYQVLVLFFPKILYNLFDLFRNPFYRVTNDGILMHYRKRDTHSIDIFPLYIQLLIFFTFSLRLCTASTTHLRHLKRPSFLRENSV